MKIINKLQGMFSTLVALSVGSLVLGQIANALHNNNIFDRPIDRHRYIGCPEIKKEEKPIEAIKEDYFVKSKYD